jgi:hypothetical protein
MPSNVGVALPVGNWPQINNVADSLNLNRLGLPPSLALKEQGINRYQQLANILMQRGLTPAQGQMAGRFYVPPTWAQGAAQLGSAAAGVGLNIAGEYQRQDIADESQNILASSLKKYRDSIAPQEVQTKAADTRSVNGSGVSPQLPYGIDPNVMPSRTLPNGMPDWDINSAQPDTTQQVQDNKNAIALNTPPPQEAPLQGVYHDLTQAPMLDKQPLVDALQQRYDSGEQYTRQPFQQPQSQVTVSGAEYAMQERTPQEKQQALVELMASQHPQAQAIAAALQQQQAKAAENDQQERFHKDDVRLKELGITENAGMRQETMKNTMAMKEMQLAQMEREGLRDDAAKQRHDSLMKSLADDRNALTKMELQAKKEQLAIGKTPPGYRTTQDGNLEAIPGGPADTKLQGALNQDTAMLQNSVAGLDRMASTANQLLNHPGLAGIVGVRGKIPDIPGTDAADARALINTLKSQVGFGVLQEMRNNSKTGGALGSVSDAEGKRLENNLAAIDTTQSLDQIKKQIKEGILDYVESAKGRLRDAYNMKHKSGEPLPMTPSGKGPAIGTLDGGYRYKGGDPAKPESWEKAN